MPHAHGLGPLAVTSEDAFEANVEIDEVYAGGSLRKDLDPFALQSKGRVSR
jgi:hypothetical protein